MLSWEVHTLGGGEALVNIFNGIAAMTEGSFFLSMIKVSLLFGLLWILIEVSFNQRFSHGPKWFIGFILIFNLAFVPKVSLVIHDDIEQRYVGKVDNVPILLGMLVGLKSQIEIGLTKAAETAFSPVDDLKYSRSGMLMGGKLVDMAAKAQIIDHRLLESVSHFMRQCVFYDIRLHLYTLDDLRNAEDTFKFISENTSVNRSFGLWNESAKNWEIKECKDGCPILSQQIQKEIDKNAVLLGKKLFPKSTMHQARTLFLNRLPQAYDSLFKTGARDASEILKQSIMINAIKGSEENRFQGQYAAARADIQSKMAYLATKRQAETWVPVLKTVLEALFYGIFPLVFLLSLLPVGYRVLMSYIEVMIWLASWGPLYAILNAIMSWNLGTKAQAAAMLLDGSVAVTLGTQGGIEAVHHDIAILAGYLSLSIPFIAAGLTKGVSAMSGLATSMLAVPQSAASSAASEATTGNISLGNLNMDNLSYNTETANRLQASAVMSNYGMQIQNTHGGLSTITAGGESRFDQTGAFSRTPAISATLDNNLANSYSSEASSSLTQGLGQTHQSMEHRGKAMQMITQAALNDRIQTSSGTNYSKTMSTEQRRSLEEFDRASEAFAKDIGLSRNVAAQYLVQAGLSSGPIAKLAGTNTGGSISHSGSINAQRNFKVAQDFVKGRNLGKAINIAEGLMKAKNLNIMSEKGESINDSINRNLDQSSQLSEQSQISLSKANSLSERVQHIRSHTESMRSDLTQPFIDYMRYEGNLSDHKVQELLSGGNYENHKELLEHYKRFSESSSYFEKIGENAYEEQGKSFKVITTGDDLKKRHDEALNRSIEENVKESFGSIIMEDDLIKRHNEVLDQPIRSRGSSFNERWNDRNIDNPEILDKEHNIQKTKSASDQDNLNTMSETKIEEAGCSFENRSNRFDLSDEVISGIQKNERKIDQIKVDSNDIKKQVGNRGVGNDRNLIWMETKEIPGVRSITDGVNKYKENRLLKKELLAREQNEGDSLDSMKIFPKESNKSRTLVNKEYIKRGKQMQNSPLELKKENESYE